MHKIERTSELEWGIWRLVIANVATLSELKTVYTVEDLYDLHEALDIKQALEEESNEKSSKRSPKR